MSEINIKTRIIGKSGNLLILSNDWDASLDDPLAEGFIVEVDTGVHLTETYPIDYLFRINEELEWTPMNVFYDKVYPEYGFASHKGYGTAFHIEAIKENGLCLIHRRSFIKEDWLK